MEEEYEKLIEIDFLFSRKLDELYSLTIIEQQRSLTRNESDRYVKIVDFLRDNNVPIEFGIEM